MVNLENCQLILNKLQCMFSKKKCQARFYKFLDLMPAWGCTILLQLELPSAPPVFDKMSRRKPRKG